MKKSEKSKFLQGDMLVGLSAALIALCALAVSLYEANLMREEQRAAVLPMLELARSYYIDNEGRDNASWRLSLHAENVGIGPALIRDFIVTVDGEPQPNWRTAMERLIGAGAALEFVQSQINGRTIPPERTVVMFDLRQQESARRVYEAFDRLNFEACFCSVFDECWTTSFHTFGSAVAVDACQGSVASFEQ